MRSIRLTLIVYFLVLLALALGGVSWLAYETSAEALLGKQASTEGLIKAQYEQQWKETEAALDQNILDKATILANKARFRVHLELYFPPAYGMLAAGLQPQGYLTARLWFALGDWSLTRDLYKDLNARSSEIVIEDADDINRHQDHEYFQTYNGFGQTQQRSANMEGRSLASGKDIRKSMDLVFGAHWDTVEPEPGWKLRRVTLKAQVRMPPFGPKGPGGKGPKGPNAGRMQGRPSGPVIFVQYASELGPLESKLSEFRDKRDDALAEQASETHDTLVALRFRLLWICLATFAGIVAGGFVLIRLGLAPLARLSEAVSRVSERDFRLKIKQEELPTELQPIAARLAGTLEQLKQAFAREKQAAADISHELRTPLAAMMTTLELALKKTRTTAEYREMLEDIRSSGAQMAQLVERLLALARLDAGADRLQAKEIDARDVARQCTNMIRPLAEARGLALRLNAPEPVPLKTDPDKLREIVNNLLHNAVEYNRPQGAIDLNVARVNGHVQLAVSDTGIGITPEQREHIFERFFRADSSRHADSPHAGLGLAIVKSYLDLMGGTIGVASGAEGSTFTVELPVQ
jgi:heavy metal sensor kinase